MLCEITYSARNSLLSWLKPTRDRTDSRSSHIIVSMITVQPRRRTDTMAFRMVSDGPVAAA